MRTILLSFLLFFTAYADANGCSCADVGSGEENYKTSDFIFKGQPLKREIVVIDYLNNEWTIPEKLIDNFYSKGKLMTRYTVNVVELYKGIRKERTEFIYTGLDGGDCGSYFEISGTYVIYADRMKGFEGKTRFGTSICSRNTKEHIAESSELKKFRSKRLKIPGWSERYQGEERPSDYEHSSARFYILGGEGAVPIARKWI